MRPEELRPGVEVRGKFQNRVAELPLEDRTCGSGVTEVVGGAVSSVLAKNTKVSDELLGDD